MTVRYSEDAQAGGGCGLSEPAQGTKTSRKAGRHGEAGVDLFLCGRLPRQGLFLTAGSAHNKSGLAWRGLHKCWQPAACNGVQVNVQAPLAQWLRTGLIYHSLPAMTRRRN